MALRYFEVEEKGTKEKVKAVDLNSLIETINSLEQLNGTTEAKIFENYYEIKKQVFEIMLAEEKEVKKEEVKKDEPNIP